MKKIITLVMLTILIVACQNTDKEKNQRDFKNSTNKSVNKNSIKSNLTGIDIHDINTDIDWNTVAASDASFIFIKASQGYALQSTTFHNQWKSAKNAGLIRGAYHYYIPSDPVNEQVNLFIRTAYNDWDTNDLPPVLDLEVPPRHISKQQYRNNIKHWLELVCEKFNRKPIIYVSPSFAREYLDVSFSEYNLWQAEWNTTKPQEIWNKNGWIFWQYQDSVTNIPGFGQWVDLNYFNGNSMEALKAITNNNCETE